MKGIVLLGSTGSIGSQALEVIGAHPDLWRVVALAARQNVALIVEQAIRHRPAAVALEDREAARQAREALTPFGIEVLEGAEGVADLAAWPDAQLVLAGIVGTAGLRPTLRAVEAGREVAIANKETLAVAGPVILEAARRHGSLLIPVDSEHSAIFQCVQGERPQDLRRIILTASGGPFRQLPREALDRVTRAEALRHPVWKMGDRITIDSATLMNKGLEVIEAHWLFGLPYDRIEVVIHPQSIVHSLVEMIDGSVLAQLGTPDMRLPIQYALGYPERLPAMASPLDLTAIGQLTFERPDHDRFPCLGLAYAAGRAGATVPAVLNAAKEVAVDAFLADRIRFTAIPRIIAAVVDQHKPDRRLDLETILMADAWARRTARTLVERM